MDGPLTGIRVIEFATTIAVPYGTYLLATQGADVIKVENTGRGDELRAVGSQKNGLSALYLNCNAGKRSIAIDVRSDRGRDVLWQLIEGADVFVQGFRPGSIDRLGFGAEAALARNPRLVYLSAFGYGSDGPYSLRPTYDGMIQALSGWAGAQLVDGEPTNIRSFAADKVAAITSAQAITAALVARARTGKGQHIETTMLESNVAFQWPDVMMHCTLLDEDATQLPNLLQSIRMFACADGYIALTVGTNQQWEAFCTAMSRPELADDERFATAGARSSNFVAWYRTFDELVAPLPLAEAIDRLVSAGVPAAPVLDPADVAADPQLVARGAVREVEHPVAGRYLAPRPAARFSGYDPAMRPAPTQGQQTDEILAELGYSGEDISELRSTSAVVQAGARGVTNSEANSRTQSR